MEIMYESKSKLTVVLYAGCRIAMYIVCLVLIFLNTCLIPILSLCLLLLYNLFIDTLSAIVTFLLFVYSVLFCHMFIEHT